MWCYFSLQTSSTFTPKGGFRIPQQYKKEQSEKERKFKRRSNVGDSAETRPLDFGDFQMAVIRGNTEQIKQYLDKGKLFCSYKTSFALIFNQSQDSEKLNYYIDTVCKFVFVPVLCFLLFCIKQQQL